MGDDPDPIPSGSRGTVLAAYDMGPGMGIQVEVAWDSGRSLALVGGVDSWKILTAEKM
jgi:hypothetical protein